MSNTYLNLTLITVPVGTTRPLKAAEKNPQGQVAEGSRKKVRASPEQYFHSTIKGTDLCILITKKLAIELSWSIGSHCTLVCNHDFLDTNITTAVIAFHYHP